MLPLVLTPQQLGPLWCTDMPDFRSEELGGKLRFCVPERIKSQNVVSTIGKFEQFYHGSNGGQKPNSRVDNTSTVINIPSTPTPTPRPTPTLAIDLPVLPPPPSPPTPTPTNEVSLSMLPPPPPPPTPTRSI